MCHDGRRLEEYRETHTNVTGTGPHLEHIRVRPRAVFLKGQHGAQCRRERDQADDDGRAVTRASAAALCDMRQQR